MWGIMMLHHSRLYFRRTPLVSCCNLHIDHLSLPQEHFGVNVPSILPQILTIVSMLNSHKVSYKQRNSRKFSLDSPITVQYSQWWIIDSRKLCLTQIAKNWGWKCKKMYQIKITKNWLLWSYDNNNIRTIGDIFT